MEGSLEFITIMRVEEKIILKFRLITNLFGDSFVSISIHHQNKMKLKNRTMQLVHFMKFKK